jgi:hypothetical protein
MHSIIKNSRTTLVSLDIQVDGLSPNDELFVNERSNATGNKETGFDVLQSLSLNCYRLEDGAAEALLRTIDFTKLTELTFGDFGDGSSSIFLRLAELARTSTSQGIYMNLRSLIMSLREFSHTATPEEINSRAAAKYGFISSFDNLKALELKDYGQYPEQVTTNPGLALTLLQAILKHKSLKSLGISYQGKMSGLAIPYLSATTIGAIVDGLPELEEFEFAPVEADIVSKLTGSSLSWLHFFSLNIGNLILAVSTSIRLGYH